MSLSNIIKQRNSFSINAIKIGILIFISIFLLGNFQPYYEGNDSFLYGMTAVNLVETGMYGYTNELLEEYGSNDFINKQWTKTIYNTAIPKAGFGIFGLAAISYFIGGLYGLFYFGPIITILFLILSERIATNLFGRFVGLITLVLLSADFIIIKVGQQLLTDNIFSLLFILGIFYLIKFFRQRKDKFILFSSIFLAASTTIRLNGIMSFPFEIFLVLGFFVFQTITKNQNIGTKFSSVESFFPKLTAKRIFKIGAYLLIPWLIFFLIFFAYNDHYYGDPLTDYQKARQSEFTESKKSLSDFLVLDSQRFEIIKFYSVSLLPDYIKSNLLEIVSDDWKDFLGKNWLGFFSFIILVSALALSIYSKNKRTEVIVLTVFILSVWSFYSSSYIQSNFDFANEVRDRYMIPTVPLSFMLFGYIMHRIWKTNFEKISSNQLNVISKGLKGTFLIVLILFLIVSFYDSYPVQKLTQSNFVIKDPESFASRYPLDSEGLTEKSVIVAGGRSTIEYNAIPLHPYHGISIDKFDVGSVPQEPIQMLKKIMTQGYEAYVFKGPMTKVNFEYFNYLEAEHGIILKDYSNTFCKLEQINKQSITGNKEKEKSDFICYFGKQAT